MVGATSVRCEDAETVLELLELGDLNLRFAQSQVRRGVASSHRICQIAVEMRPCAPSVANSSESSSLRM